MDANVWPFNKTFLKPTKYMQLNQFPYMVFVISLVSGNVYYQPVINVNTFYKGCQVWVKICIYK